MTQDRWHTMTVEEVASTVGADLRQGLSPDEAARRLADDGPNTIREERRVPAWLRFASQFNDFMIYVLLVAAGISALEGNGVEAGAILAIVLINGVLGFVQESRAERALQALQAMAAPEARVIRGAIEKSVPASELARGDLIVLQAGDAVPADGRLVEAVAMRAEEAALTGESVPVSKSEERLGEAELALGDRRNLVYAGTHIAAGRGRAIVTATGMRTEMGKIAELLEMPDEHTPLQRELQAVGRRIAVLVLAVAAIVFGTGLLRGNDASKMFLVAVSLAVAAIPEGLPAVVTTALALAVQRMASRNAIVRRLHAVETLGSTQVICTDKTGTLTVNEMVVTSVASARHAWPGDGQSLEQETQPSPELGRLRLIARNCNDARASDDRFVGDPTEIALLRFAQDAPELERLDEAPFDSDRKRMTVVARLPDRSVAALVKGAPDVVLARCTAYLHDDESRPLDDTGRRHLEEKVERLARSGRRTLAAAFRQLDEPWPVSPEELERDLVFVGLYALADPPRPEVPEAVDLCRSAGIRVIMVTGDHKLTAEAIAREIGLADEQRGEGRPEPDLRQEAQASTAAWALSGPEVDRLTDEEFKGALDRVAVFARVSPSHKLRIIDSLKARRQVVAMTGDGVNDAPALKRADIGVAMGRVGTDVTREAADMVLADDNFATIVSAVREGRAVFDNIRKVILFLLSCNVSEVLIVFFSMFLIGTPALLPLQILWINLVTDGFPALALGVDPPERDIMKRPPRRRDQGILVTHRQLQIGVQGALITAGGLAALMWSLRWDASFEAARSVLFTTMVLTQLLHSLTFRSERRSVFSKDSLRNRRLLAAIAGSLLLHAAVIYLLDPALGSALFKTVPLSAQDWLVVSVCSLGPLALIDIAKRLAGQRLDMVSGTT